MKVYRYFVTYSRLSCYDVEVTKETPTYFYLASGSKNGSQNRTKIAKKENGKAVLKDSTHYPYIDFYSTEDQSREFAIENIIKYLKNMDSRKKQISKMLQIYYLKEK